MNTKCTLRYTLALFGVAMVFMLTAAVMPAFAQCEKVTDAQIVSEIYGKIKADKGLASQISHINVVSASAAVKFFGWANSKSDFGKLRDIAVNTSCVKLVNVNNLADTPPAGGSLLRSGNGCAAGTKACGDLCIPESDPCNIGGEGVGIAELFTMPVLRELGFLSVSSGCN